MGAASQIPKTTPRARTLARKVLRQQRDARGVSSAMALDARCKAFRVALASHWTLCDDIGVHTSGMAEAAEIARLLGFTEHALEDALESQALGNWARHSPPPGAQRPTAQPGQAIEACELERQLTEPVFEPEARTFSWTLHAPKFIPHSSEYDRSVGDNTNHASHADAIIPLVSHVLPDVWDHG